MINQIRSIQKEMAADIVVVESFSEEEVENLKVIIRITLEVSSYLKGDETLLGAERELRYNLETIISGIEFFTALTSSYDVLIGALPSGLIWDNMSGAGLKRTILETCDRFLAESVFMKKCRVLLDLFKLELALVATSYG